MRKVYLDYSATTPVKKEVLETMLPYFSEEFGNPSSLYEIGAEVKKALGKARKQVAELINADEKEIFFTSGGTESDNWAILGVADTKKAKGKHIITTKVEHHAVLHTCEFLEKHGYEITYLDIDSNGFVRPEDLEKAIREDTILVSVMLVNNEIGTIQPVKELVKVTKAHGVLFHTDAVQALGNCPIDVKDLGVDMLSASAHKIYGPKGVGALYIKKGLNIGSSQHGGAQENKKRAGTENTPGIVGFGKAAEIAKKNLKEHIDRTTKLRNYLIDRVLTEIEDTFLNGDREKRHPGNANLTFEYIEGEAMLLMLDMQGISVSTGSACSSASLTPSHVLSALGIPVEKIHGTLRMTVGDFTTKEDIDYTVDILKTVVKRLREVSSVSKEKGW